MCATIGKTAGGVYHCATCFEGYINTGGKCLTKEDFCLHSADGLTVDAACGTLTS